MVVDSSALVAILLGEEDAGRFALAIEGASPRLLSAASLLEASIVVETRKGYAAAEALDLLIYRAGLEVVPVDQQQVEIAREAWRRFGKGRHPASLNYGDCFAYALARTSGAPILFKGDDFSLTDLKAVPLP